MEEHAEETEEEEKRWVRPVKLHQPTTILERNRSAQAWMDRLVDNSLYGTILSYCSAWTAVCLASTCSRFYRHPHRLQHVIQEDRLVLKRFDDDANDPSLFVFTWRIASLVVLHPLPFSTTLCDFFHLNGTPCTSIQELTFVKSMRIHVKMNSIMKKSFPPNLTALDLCDFDGAVLPGVLPSTLLKLSTGTPEDGPFVKGCFPAGLKELTLNAPYRHVLTDGILPSTLQRLTMTLFNSTPLVAGILPNQLRYLDLSSSARIAQHVIPHSVRHLVINADSWYSTCQFRSHSFPSSMRILDICTVRPYYYATLLVFPTTLHTIILDEVQKKVVVVKEFPPPSVKHLFIRTYYPTITKDTFPDNLEILSILNCRTKLTRGGLPPNLQCLTFGTNLIYTLQADMFPSSLRYLILSCPMNLAFDQTSFPPHLEGLVLNPRYDQWLEKDDFPSTLTYLSIPRYIEWTYENRWDDWVHQMNTPEWLDFDENSHRPKEVEEWVFKTVHKWYPHLDWEREWKQEEKEEEEERQRCMLLDEAQ